MKMTPQQIADHYVKTYTEAGTKHVFYSNIQFYIKHVAKIKDSGNTFHYVCDKLRAAGFKFYMD